MNLTTVRSRIIAALRIAPAGWHGAATAWRWAAWLLLPATLCLAAFPDITLERVLGSGVLIVLALGAAIGAFIVLRILRTRDHRFWWALFLFVCAMLVLLGSANIPMKGQAATVVAGLVAVGMFGGSLALWRGQGPSLIRVIGLIVGAGAVVGILTAAVISGWPIEAQKRAPVAVPQLSLPDPSVRGDWAVDAFAYGSGTDRHRPEFAADVRVRSRTVDGSRLIDGWDGAAGWARTRYWGFDAKALPLNGRVWMPAAQPGGVPSPVVLIVHGNHDMEDYSDTGYGWIGEHLASRGMVAISIDENFFNSSYSDLLSGLDGGLEKENDARGWLLLEHLRQLREWNAADGNPFSGRLDPERVVLIGHSRGGEAVAEAALFNRMKFYPDDARQTFDFGFGITGLIAIAPADGQYDPRDRKTRIDDVSYLVIHGSLDGDVQSFQGASQYARIGFPECLACFKTSIYVIGANHGQFNTSWGRSDYGGAGRMSLNLAPVMDADLQRAVALPLFTAFIETVAFGDTGYRELFASGLRAAPFVNEPVELVTDYAAGDQLVIADFEEDADLSTATLPAARIESTGLSRWRESEVSLKWEPRDSAAVLIGWDRAGKDSPMWQLVFEAPPPTFDSLGFSLAMAEESPLMDEDGEWTTPGTLDFSIELEDRSGQSVRLSLSESGVLRAPVESHTRKHPWLDGVSPSEPVFARCTIQAKQLAPLDLSEVLRISLRFDKQQRGAIWVDDVAVQPAVAPAEPFDVESGG